MSLTGDVFIILIQEGKKKMEKMLNSGEYRSYLDPSQKQLVKKQRKNDLSKIWEDLISEFIITDVAISYGFLNE